MLDPRVGRWFSPDPLQKASQTYYSFGANNPIIFVDPDGKDDYYFDMNTKSMYVIKNGAPNRYFIAQYQTKEVITEENYTISVTQYAGNMQHSINSKEVKEIFTNNVHLYRQALAITSRDSEDYAKIYYAHDSVDDVQVLAATFAIPLVVIGVAEIGVGTLVKEGIENGLEELTGIPIITNPVDLLVSFFKKGGKELVEESVEKIVKINKTKYPEAAKHIEDAKAAGHPEILTVDRTASKANRRASLKGTKTKPNMDRDEYPPAMTKEGGKGASVKHINPSQNRGAGKSMGSQLKDVPNGGKFKIETE